MILIIESHANLNKGLVAIIMQVKDEICKEKGSLMITPPMDSSS